MQGVMRDSSMPIPEVPESTKASAFVLYDATRKAPCPGDDLVSIVDAVLASLKACIVFFPVHITDNTTYKYMHKAYIGTLFLALLKASIWINLGPYIGFI